MTAIKSVSQKQANAATAATGSGHSYGWRLFAVVFLVTLGSSFQNGYLVTVLNVPGHVFTNFLNSTSAYSMDSFYLTSLWSFIVSSRTIGQITGALAASPIADSIGRQKGLLLITVPLLVSLVLEALAYVMGKWTPLLIGRIIQGFSCGAYMVLVPVFLNEIAPLPIRGALTVVHNCLMDLGCLVGFFVGLPDFLGTEKLWPYLMLIPAIPAFIQLLIMPFAHESPKFLLIEAQDDERAKQAIIFYQKPSSDDEIDGIMDSIRREGLIGEKLPVRDLCRSSTLKKSLRLAICIGILQAVAGAPIMNSYSTEIMFVSGAPIAAAQFGSVAMGIVALLFECVLAYLIEACGRRPLLIFGSCFILIAQVSNFALQVTDTYKPDMKWTVYGLMTVILTWSTTAIAMVGVYTVIPVELFPQQVRSMGKAIEQICYFATTLVFALVFLPMLESWGAYCFLTLLIPTLCLTIYTSIYVPETKGRPIADIMDEIMKTAKQESGETMELKTPPAFEPAERNIFTTSPTNHINSDSDGLLKNRKDSAKKYVEEE